MPSASGSADVRWPPGTPCGGTPCAVAPCPHTPGAGDTRDTVQSPEYSRVSICNDRAICESPPRKARQKETFGGLCFGDRRCILVASDTTTLTVPSKTPGLGPLHLKPGSASHLKALVARKARRLDKRVRRLRVRKGSRV